MVKMLGLIEQLSCDIGERFAGTPGEHKAADAILRAFQQFDGGAHLDEINFLGWVVEDWPKLTIGRGEDRRQVDCAPIVYSGATEANGVRGTLERWDKKILIAGLYEPPVYALVDAGRIVSQIVVAPSDDAIPLLNPDPLFVLPMIAVGTADHTLIEQACKQKWPVEVAIGSRVEPNARSYNVVARYRGNPASNRRAVERLVGISRALAARPRFLLLDEPAAGMNDAEGAKLADLIKRIPPAFGCGVLLIEHNMPVAMAVCERLHVLQGGRTLAVGPREEVRQNREVIQSYLGSE